MPVPVMGMVAKWTKKTAKPMGNGANICDIIAEKNEKIKLRWQPDNSQAN